jgi:hypothetical protein
MSVRVQVPLRAPQIEALQTLNYLGLLLKYHYRDIIMIRKKYANN